MKIYIMKEVYRMDSGEITVHFTASKSYDGIELIVEKAVSKIESELKSEGVSFKTEFTTEVEAVILDENKNVFSFSVEHIDLHE